MMRAFPRSLTQRWPVLAGGITFAVIAHQVVRHKGSVANDSHKTMISLLNPAQVSATLREHEESYMIDRKNGVIRFDIGQLASNNPIEDDFSSGIVQVPLATEDDKEFSTDWMFWGVYDGHGGWSTSAKLREALIPAVTRELQQAYKPLIAGSSRRLVPDPQTVDQSLKDAFVKLDDQIVNKSVEKLLANRSVKTAAEGIPPAISGSCALMAFYDSHSRDLRVAVAGDSRAVLGERQSDGSWTARALTTDQTGSNEDEVRRIRSEHPGEQDTCVRNGRVLGIYEPTRAFGDASTKWPRDVQSQVSHEFFGRRIPRDLRTPPYMTAEPVVTRTKIEKPGFLVMATDGLYEMLSNEQIVSLVVEWIEKKKPHSLRSMQPKKDGFVDKWIRPGRKQSVVEDVSSNKDAQKPPIRRRKEAPQNAIVDDNCSTHLIRNALGGANQDQVSMLVSIPAPLSRRYRDDLTVTVVFFGESDQNNGSVRVNKEATEENFSKPKL